MNNRILGLLGLATKAGKIVFGADAVIEQIQKNKVKLVLIAKDASERSKKRFFEICEKEVVNIYEFACIDEISKSIGKNNKAIIGVKDENFSSQIIKIINGGEIIG